MSVARIKKNDTVVAIAGESAGKTGKVLRVMADKGLAVVQGLKVVKKGVRISKVREGDKTVRKSKASGKNLD